MSVRFMTLCVVSALALSAAGVVAAAEAEKGMVSRVYNDSVAPADQVAYETGVKAYNKCLADHGFKYTWTAWGHETGNVYLYSYVTGPHTWADYDAMGEAGKACDNAWRTNANPHLKGEVSGFLELKPELSHMPKDNAAKPFLMNVVFFTLKPGREANDSWTEAVKKIAAAAEKSNWPNNFMVQRVRSGGKDFPDYVLTAQFKSWADYGASPNSNVWKMVEGVYGKQEADAIRKAVNDAATDINSHLDRYNEDLTYTASSK
jgi:hypothetical protein